MKIKHLENLVDDMEKRGFLAWAEELKQVNQEVEIYLVGGAVRDALLGVENVKDYDFVVRGVEFKKLGRGLGKMGKVNLVGKNFGVYKFLPKGKKIEVPYDIALPRTEISFRTGGYRDFDVSYNHKLNIKEDLGRRDFTINALAYDIFNKKLMDEFGGVKDLKNKIIKTVGNAYERFEEDYSRMLRAIRFGCQLGFQIEGITWKAIQELMPKINSVKSNERVIPYEVIASELIKAFVLNPVHAFDLYDKSGVSQELIPEILKMKGCEQPENWHSEGDVWEHTRLGLKELQGRSFVKRFKNRIIFEGKVKSKNEKVKSDGDYISAELVMAVMLHDIGKSYTIQTPEKDGTDRIRFNEHDNVGAKIAKKICERLRLSAAPEFDLDPDRVGWLVSNHHLFDKKKIGEMKNSTIEKYFFSEKYSGEDLLKLGFIDMLSSIPDDGQYQLEPFNMMVGRIEELKKMGKDRKLPEPLLNGDEVMNILKIKAGPRVGKVMEALREDQLDGRIKSKKEAMRKIEKLEIGK